jgi:hypothetical protein
VLWAKAEKDTTSAKGKLEQVKRKLRSLKWDWSQHYKECAD